MSKKIILITGATSGIGLSTSKLLYNQGHSLILCGRNKKKLLDLSKELNNKTHFLTFDVRNKKEVFQAISSIPKEFKKIDVLINNAGNAHGLDFAHESNISDWEEMIDGNVKGVFYVTKSILDGMVANKSGQIINVGSIAGKETYPKGNVYCASKAAVEKFTEGLRLDLNPFGIRVGAINPGLVETNFSSVRFKGNEERAKKVYDGYKPLSPNDIAECISYMINAPKHVNIADLTVLPTDQAGAYVLNKSN